MRRHPLSARMSEEQLQTSIIHGSAAPNDPSSNTKWLLNNRIMRMNDAEASEDWYKFYVYFKFCLHRLALRLPPDVRQGIENDWQTFQTLIRCIEKDAKLADASKKKKIIDLQRNFAESHMHYIFQALPKAGLDALSEEASLDCGKHEFEEIKLAIRGKNSIKANLAEDEEEVKKAENAGAEKDGTGSTLP